MWGPLARGAPRAPLGLNPALRLSPTGLPVINIMVGSTVAKLKSQLFRSFIPVIKFVKVRELYLKRKVR